MPPTVKPLAPDPNGAVGVTPQLPKTDKGWQAYLSNVRAPAKRVQKPLVAGLSVLLEPSGAKTFLARLRRRGEKIRAQSGLVHSPLFPWPMRGENWRR